MRTIWETDNGRQPKSKQEDYQIKDCEPSIAYRTNSGFMIRGTAERALVSPLLQEYRGKVQLVVTSPPFPLNHKKRYGNLQGQAYLEWLQSIAPMLREMLTPDGSIVIELGNAWEPGKPVMSTLALRSLLAFQEAGGFHLCQTFVAYNPARLPSPAQWVTIERVRVKDAYTNIWWFSPSDRPKADNRRVLVPYSQHMKDLLASRKYNSGKRPSEHNIGAQSFLRDNGGAIPPNVLTFSNTSATDRYQAYCRHRKLRPHPARMPQGIVEFFVRFLSDQGDLVMDPFAGSNTTGAVAESLERRWIGIEPNIEYILSSKGRFDQVFDADEGRIE